MHHHGLSAHGAQENHVSGEGGLERVIHHRVAAVLHDDDLVAVVLQPRQGFREHSGAVYIAESLNHLSSLLLLGAVRGVDLHVVVGQVGGAHESGTASTST